jgi:rRNA-processing protein FCF1
MREGYNQTKRALRIILDSNALFVPLELKIDIFEELNKLLKAKFEAVLLSPVNREIEKLAKEASPQVMRNALYALKLTEKCNLIEIEEEPDATPDDVIVEVAGKWGCPVFTNDRQLRKRLRDINVPVIYVRQKSRLEVDGRL